jgi:hypothetical protein
MKVNYWSKPAAWLPPHCAHWDNYLTFVAMATLVIAIQPRSTQWSAHALFAWPPLLRQSVARHRLSEAL